MLWGDCGQGLAVTRCLQPWQRFAHNIHYQMLIPFAPESWFPVIRTGDEKSPEYSPGWLSHKSGGLSRHPLFTIYQFTANSSTIEKSLKFPKDFKAFKHLKGFRLSLRRPSGTSKNTRKYWDGFAFSARFCLILAISVSKNRDSR